MIPVLNCLGCLKFELNRELQKMKAKVRVNCVHPGVVRTGLTRDKDRFFTGKYLVIYPFATI